MEDYRAQAEREAVQVLAQGEWPDNPTHGLWRAECMIEWLRNAGIEVVRADDHRGAVEEAERLREAIEKAPHASHCEAASPIWPGPCTCWKRSTLHPIGGR